MKKTDSQIIKELKKTIKDRELAIINLENMYTDQIGENTTEYTKRIMLEQDVEELKKKIQELEDENGSLERLVFELEEENRDMYSRIQELEKDEN